ncbi:MAG: hypothetical protein IPO57_10030 [Rhodocyclales bacterium]|nr:hypothetical protein [Rhodocyclales bacterium]
MPYVTIRSVSPNTTGNRGAYSYSRIGHAWVEISDSQFSQMPNGGTESFGFYPEQEGQPYMPGEVKSVDYDNFVGHGNSSPPIYITEEQAQALRDFADQVDANGFYSVVPGYFGSGQNCAAFVFSALSEVGITTRLPARTIFPWWIPGQFDPALGNLFELEIGSGARFDLAQLVLPRRDPLTLDLDGDGLETVGVAAGILFDHDGDGVASGTGWVGSDDGFLVLDRNSNGQIDNGTELFGDSTPLSGGGTAADGFAALAQEDTNADGRVDSLDANWNALRVWRDLNQDGVSQSGELFTLDSLGIAALDVAVTEHTQTLPNGNQVADLGSYVRSDGSTGTLAQTGQMADVNLADDTFHRQFPDTVPLTPEAQSLPDMQGSGLVRDLREAASQSGALANLLAQYAAAPTRAAQRALLDQLLDAWADTSSLAERLEERSSHYRFRFMAFGDVRRSQHVTAVDDLGTPYVDTDATDVTLGADATLNRLDATYRGLIEEWSQRIHILEAFNGRYFFNLPGQTQTGLSAAEGLIELNDGPHYDAAGGVGTLMIGYSQGQLDLLNQSYEALRESVYAALILQTLHKGNGQAANEIVWERAA